jgi:hypothetical protein
MKLTDAACRTARPTDAPYKLADGHGMYLHVKPNGSRLWRLDFSFERRRLTMSFGPYPEVSLQEARELREAARRKLRHGLNPIDERKAVRVAAQVMRANTFGLVADELIALLRCTLRAEAAQGAQ